MKMKLKYFSLLFILFISPFIAAEEVSSFRRFQKLQEFQEKLQQRFESAPTYPPISAPSASTPKLMGRVVFPIGYGADPSGARESSDAILEALNDAFEMMRSGLQMLPRVKDLGGVVIDLQGGCFSISKPIAFPASGLYRYSHRRSSAGSCHQRSLPRRCLDGEFGVVDQVVIHQNNANGMSLRSTVGKLTVAGNGTRWVADFSPVLVFPDRVNHFQYSFWAQAGLMPVHAVTNISNNAVVVETDRDVTGVVSVVVEQ